MSVFFLSFNSVEKYTSTLSARKQGLVNIISCKLTAYDI